MRVASLPQKIRDVFSDAVKLDRLVILSASGAGCPDCKRMDDVTYADAAVQKTIAEHFLHLALDAEKDAETVKLLATPIVPAVVIFRADGIELARIEGFVTPDAMTTRLHMLTNGK